MSEPLNGHITRRRSVQYTPQPHCCYLTFTLTFPNLIDLSISHPQFPWKSARNFSELSC